MRAIPPVVFCFLIACGESGPPKLKTFAPSFEWGTATAPYQVEGGLHDNDWFQWESSTANKAMDHADDGPNQYALYDTDARLAEELGTNAMRLGIDWSRLFPTEESFPNAPNAEAVAHYHAVFASLKAHGQRPMVTLYHWVFPRWIQDLADKEVKRGWLDDATITRFSEFARWAATEYGGEVDTWITLNEPTVNLAAGYLTANHPPLRTFSDVDGIKNAGRAARAMIRAHAAAYDALHAADTVDADGDGVAARVSCAFHFRLFEPANPENANDVAAANQIHYISNQLFLNALVHGDLDGDFDGALDGAEDRRADASLMNRVDFIGVNYYGISRVIGFGGMQGAVPGLIQSVKIDDDRPRSEFGWSIYPDGFRTVLDEAAAYGRPLYITENGVADAHETLRPRFVVDHLYVMQRAIQDGVDVRGYYHWTLIDNYEWAGGYCPRFGLYRVDFDDPARPRTPGEGAEVYERIIRERGVDPSLFSKYPKYAEPSIHCEGGG